MEETNTPKRKTRGRQTAAAPLVNEYGHLQPQALELEVAVLGALMVDSDAIGRLGDMLKPESFYDKRHQLIFDAIREMDRSVFSFYVKTIYLIITFSDFPLRRTT